MMAISQAAHDRVGRGRASPAPSRRSATHSATLTFVKVINDSRCPKDAQCIWAGEVTIALTVSVRSATEDVELPVRQQAGGPRPGAGHRAARDLGLAQRSGRGGTPRSAHRRGNAEWLPDDTRPAQAAFALLAYGAAILSFLGAIHWGLALRDPGDPPAAMLAWGVLPSLAAWVALVWGGSAGLFLLAAALWACWAVDRSVYPRYGLAGWLAMRLNLTAVASLACVGAALHSLR